MQTKGLIFRNENRAIAREFVKPKKKYKILVHCRELNCDHVAEKKINPLKLKKKKEKNVISMQRKKNLAVNIKYEKILSF